MHPRSSLLERFCAAQALPNDLRIRNRSDPRGCVTRVDRRYLIVIHEENNEDKGVEERNCAYARARDIQRKRGDQAKSRARSKSLGGSETPTKRRPSTRISSASFDYRQEVVWW
ncbi:hypothetical protein MBLNU13_g05327t1 [Cladosporium sp. NU13]